MLVPFPSSKSMLVLFSWLIPACQNNLIVVCFVYPSEDHDEEVDDQREVLPIDGPARPAELTDANEQGGVIGVTDINLAISLLLIRQYTLCIPIRGS